MLASASVSWHHIFNTPDPSSRKRTGRLSFRGASGLPGNPYSKPYKTPAEQVLLLEQRGLEIADKLLAQACLERIGYYRLSGYWYPFRKSRVSTHPITGEPLLGQNGRQVTIVEDIFRPGSSFQQVMDLYVFDKRLRLIFLDALERLEIALRVDVALLLGAYSPYAHRTSSFFSSRFTQVRSNGISLHDEWLSRLDTTFRKSNDEFVKHFKQKYHGQDLPIWIAIELWDFGMLSFLLDGMRVADQMKLAQKYSIPRPSLLVSIVRNFNNLRNICAHHGRLWNRSPADRIAPVRKGEIANLNHLNDDAYARIYASAAMMQHLLRIINPSTEWPERLKAHLETLPVSNGISSSQAGFPANWQSLPLWKSRN